MKLYNLNFHVNFLKTIFDRLPPLASAARCGPHPSYPPLATPVKQVCVEPRPSALNMALPAFAAVYDLCFWCFLSFQHLRLLFVVFTDKEIIRGRLQQIPIDIS